MRENICSLYSKKAAFGKKFILILAIFTDVILIGNYCTDPNKFVRIFCIIITIAFNLFILFYCLLRNPFQNALKKYNITEQDIDYDFQHADEVVKDMIYVGKKYLISTIYAGFFMLRNQDIVWMYKTYSRSKYGKYYYLVIYTIDKKKYTLTIPGEYDDAQEDTVMYYFSQKFPHVIIGDSLKARKMLKNDFDNFLRIKYYPGLQEERAQEAWPDDNRLTNEIG